jgi:hypothetical protein
LKITVPSLKRVIAAMVLSPAQYPHRIGVAKKGLPTGGRIVVLQTTFV